MVHTNHYKKFFQYNLNIRSKSNLNLTKICNKSRANVNDKLKSSLGLTMLYRNKEIMLVKTSHLTWNIQSE